MKKKITIEGMSCNHCVRHVTEALDDLEGVSNIEVNLKEKNALIEVETTVSEDKIKLAIEDVGYEVVGIESI